MVENNDEKTSLSQKQPQISEMFQKFALAFKTKTFEFFAEETTADDDGFSLLDSAEDFIPDQKVIILKPDRPTNQTLIDSSSNVVQQSSQQTPDEKYREETQFRPVNAQLSHTLMSSIFATVSSFEASYLQLQTAHVPFNEEGINSADEALVSHLQKLSDFKGFYKDLRRSSDFSADLPIGSCLEARVQENQSKLRVLGTVSDRLQAEIDQKDNEVLNLRKKLGDVQKFNSKLSRRLTRNLKLNSRSEVSFSVKIFESILNDACRTTHKFTKVLIHLMRKVGWDLDLAANSVHSNIEYANKGHNQYAFLSYVCLVIFRGFDLKGFGLDENETETQCNGHLDNPVKINDSMKQLFEHVSSTPLELLSRNPGCEFSRFCEQKCQELVHPSMESSIFCNLDTNEVVLSSWRSLSVFYESFVNMASSVWTLHKLAFSFDPVVEIFQVERGVDFSMVYMQDVTRKCTSSAKTKLKVGFTVIPGFKIGRTVIQSQVYLSGLKCTEQEKTS
ncbi:hypothetical protein K2173_024801 [Erythroxylum novogranatense]|uniref:DUF641 domain-containing protein n=1 Tax=Erythroxylum novogranatense TaxID=1862640 RepID=A0AAV8UHN9_9ROSI|nr:hypothetical protein K2173_024801 [Erythroxylum novogranatense]